MAILQDFYSELASEMSTVKSTLVTKLENLQSKANSLGSWGAQEDLKATKLTGITFDGLDSLATTLQGKTFVATPYSDTVGSNTTMELGRQWESNVGHFKDLETKIASIISTSNGEVLNDLSASLLPQYLQTILISAQDKSDGRDLSSYSSLLSLYPSKDQLANNDWLSFRRDLKKSDRERSIFYQLFKQAQEAFIWAQQQSIAINEVHILFTTQYNDLVKSIISSSVAIYKADTVANIAKFESKLGLLDAEVSTANITFAKKSAEYDLKMKEITQRLNIFSSNYAGVAGANMKSLATKIGAGKNVADGYKAIFSAYGGEFVGVSSQTVTTEEA